MAVFLATVAYNRPEFVRKGLEFFRANSSRDEYDEHVIFDPGYPLGDEEANRKAIKQIADDFGLFYASINNLGCHQNFQYAMDCFKAGEGDYFAPVCPDTRARNIGWVRAASQVLKTDPNCFTVQLNRDMDFNPYGAVTKAVGGYAVLEFPQLVAWSTGMFNCGLLRQIGGFGAYSKQYGYIEHYLAERFAQIYKHWYLLKDYYDTVEGTPDPLYIKWKQESAARSTEASFEVWLRGRV